MPLIQPYRKLIVDTQELLNEYRARNKQPAIIFKEDAHLEHETVTENLMSDVRTCICSPDCNAPARVRGRGFSKYAIGHSPKERGKLIANVAPKTQHAVMIPTDAPMDRTTGRPIETIRCDEKDLEIASLKQTVSTQSEIIEMLKKQNLKLHLVKQIMEL